MKKMITFLAFAGILLASFNVFAQQDITPNRYEFANQPLGPFSLDKQNQGANPPQSDPVVISNWNDGFIAINNGSFTTGTEFSGQGAILNSFFQILDMGGEVGKVLCMKGSGSTFEHGVAGNSGFWLGWWNMSFYTDPNNTKSVAGLVNSGVSQEDAEKQATVRLRATFHIHQNEVSTTNKLFDVLGYTFPGGFKGMPTPDATQAFNSGNFADVAYDEELEEEVLTYNPNKWIVCEYDYKANEEDGAPMRFTFRFGGGAQNTTLLIKSIEMIQNPQGEPVENQVIELQSNPLATPVTEIVADNQLKCYSANGVMYLQNITEGDQVVVYTIDGKVLKSIVADQADLSMSLNKGIYIVKAGDKVEKVVVQ